MITSRSDRVPLLSRRHTPAEKQNGTSDRPTDRPTLSPSLPLPSSLFQTSVSFSRFVLRPRFRPRGTVDASPSNARNAAARIIRAIDVGEAEKREREKARERTAGGGRGESSTHLFQSSRGTRDSIREINDRTRGSGRSSPERPRATKRNPVSRPSDSRNEGHGKEIPSRRANRKRDWEYR